MCAKLIEQTITKEWSALTRDCAMPASFSHLPLDSLAQVDYNYLYPYENSPALLRLEFL